MRTLARNELINFSLKTDWSNSPTLASKFPLLKKWKYNVVGDDGYDDG